MKILEKCDPHYEEHSLWQHCPVFCDGRRSVCLFITDQLTGVFAAPFLRFCFRVFVFMEYRTDVTRSGMDAAGQYLIILPIWAPEHGNKQQKTLADTRRDAPAVVARPLSSHNFSFISSYTSPCTHLLQHLRLGAK